MVSLQKLLASRTLAAIAAVAIAPLAHAGIVTTIPNITVQASPVAPPTPAGGPITTINPAAGNVGQTTAFVLNPGANQVSVQVSTNGAIVQGSVSGAYAAPVINSSGTVVTTPYFSTGGPPGAITLTFASLQSYLGLLWGSIASGDTLTFYNGGTKVATVTGDNAIAAAINYNPANGAQNYGGSQYTLINFLNGVKFNQVVLGQTGAPSFESANYQYAAVNVAAVPEPGVIALMGVGLAGLLVNRRRKACRA